MNELTPKRLVFRTEEEIEIVADAFGNPTHAPILLLHGGGQTRHSWKQTGERLAQKGWYVIATDARGHGESSWSKKGAYLSQQMAADLSHIIAQLHKKPILIGASMGGLSSLFALGIDKNLAKALILVDVSPRLEPKGTNRIINFMSANPEGYDSLEAVYEAVKGYMPHRKNIGSMKGLTKNLRQLPNGKYVWHWDPKILESWQNGIKNGSLAERENHLMDVLQSLTIPTMLIRGGISDVVSKEIVENLMESAPNMKFVDVKEAGHMVAGDSNNVFTEALINFLDTEL